MSVAPTAERLPGHRVPVRLRKKYPSRFPRATGSNRLHCWWMGEGGFDEGPLTDSLVLRLDPDRPDKHGFVEPHQEMPLADYEAAITATRPMWVRWEE
jgi:hypothetical protein